MAVSGVNGGAIPLSPNAIINGAFDIWQRGTSFSSNGDSVVAGIYTSDRWAILPRAAGNTVTVTRQTFAAGELASLGHGEAEFFARVSTPGGRTGQARFENKIENVRTFAGQTVTLSFYLRANGTKPLRATLIQRLVTGSNVGDTLISFDFEATDAWQRFSFTTTLQSMADKVIGDGSSLVVRILSEVDQAITYDIWGVQLEAGSVATPFKRHAPSLQGELAACQRYFQRFNADAGFGIYALAECSSTTQAFAFLPFITEMRARPSLASSLASTFALGHSGTNTTLSAAPTSQIVTTKAISLGCAVASGLTSGRVARLTDFSGSVNGSFIDLSAEL
jgi:hypothetical protein